MTEWEQRQLCPDGGCVGVIGSEGICNVCGRVAPNWGDERQRGLVEDDDAKPKDEGPPAEIAGEPTPPAELPEAPPEWDDRKLCPDDGCIGVIGPDGTCKVCGRSAA